MSSNVMFLDHPPSELTKGAMKVRCDVQELRERWTEFCEANTVQDLGHIATLLELISRDLATITASIESQAEARGLRWVSDGDQIVALP
jgi:hypothetical protein